MRRVPLVEASIGMHVFAAGMVATEPSWWPAAAGCVVADHLTLVAAGLWPTSTWLGPNLRRLPATAVARREVALTIDDGPDPDVTPRVLDLLDELELRATFFCIGERVRRHASLARDIVARGHGIENHSEHHRHHFSLLGPGGFEREISAAQFTIADVTGTPPRYFRAPAGLRNVFLQPVLDKLDLTLTSWTRRGFDTVKHDPVLVATRLLDGLSAGDILLVHDGHAARTGAGDPVIVDVLPRVAAALEQHDLKTVTLRAGTSR